MNDLTVGFIQQEIIPNDLQQNLAHLARNMETGAHCDLIILPEVFTTGFCPNARNYAQTENGPVYQWMAEQAQLLNCVITGSFIVKEGDDYFNRLVWMRPDGTHSYYNKRHLFRMAGEHERYASGKERVLVELNDWRILPMICYDLRFPVWSRNHNDYDLALYVANWPSARELHWNRLLQARAIENLSYIVGVNRIGTDEKQQHYAGDSAVYGPKGEIVLHAGDNAGLFVSVLRADHLKSYREQFPAHLDSDDFSLKI